MRRFEARWDAALRASTAVVCAVAVVVPAAGAWLALGRGATALAFALLLVPALLLPLAAALAPRGYAVSGRDLVVERALRPVVVPLADVRAALRLPDDALGPALLGAGGAFGRTGRLRTARLGSLRLFTTRSRGLVLVDTAQGRLVLSPEHPERFVEALLAAAPHAARGVAPP